jgi:hypothetical protein
MRNIKPLIYGTADMTSSHPYIPNTAGLVQISSYFQTINTLNSEINFQDVREQICEQLVGNLNQNVQ